ncbi:MAG: TIGR02647 family protein [Psychromonas sp.]|nr:TIGR02647 family protein [Psychromonas sp.]
MIKNYSDTLFEEMKLLAKFPEKSQLEGIKIHHSAGPGVLAAAKSLFEKGLITQEDGGYLTDFGLETADHLHHLLATLS